MKTIQEKYEAGKSDRSSFVSRGEDYSKMTLPYILPQTEGSSSAVNQHGYQALGAYLTNYLANKVAKALFPTDSPFFKLEMDDSIEDVLGQLGKEAWEIEEQFAKVEKKAMKKLAKLQMKPKQVLLAKHLIITGNVALVVDTETNDVFVHGLKNYVVNRDTAGNLLSGYIEEKVAFMALPEEVKDKIRPDHKGKEDDEIEDQNLYSAYELQADGTWKYTQAVEEHEVTTKEYTKYTLPFIPLRWNEMQGESYGRGLAEDCANDLHVVTFLSEARA